MTKQKGGNKQLRSKDTRLEGMIWDLLRMQLKVMLTAGGAVYVFIIIGYTFTTTSEEPIQGGLFQPLFNLGENPVALFVITSALTAIFLISGWFYAYSYGLSLKKTIHHFIHQLKQFHRGSLNKKITVQGRGELQKLANEVNELTDDLERQIVSMRRLVNENASLIEEAEKGAGLEERRKLARDLHDAVSQELFAVSMSLGAMPKVLAKNKENAVALFKQIEQMVHHAQQELRALIMHLRPVTLEGKSLTQAMESLMEELCKKHPAMHFHCDLKAIPHMEKGIEEQLFRVLQEGLSNVMRHANAKTATIDAKMGQHILLIVMEDDGDGFDSETIHQEKTGNYGLLSMKERLVELGGHLTIVSYPGKGTKLEFRVPLTKQIDAEGGNNRD
ncbi:sensor histidine kinase [Salipaludibacillus agaradhaerens]|uniref:histidine kinase n=1 Tax=Salipaludibacillus agaradhaerens TaxID=76935 RepID=A0A9Q4B0H7_SALAG|nr:sensor histidine kinase [Salipaludibacillus agaradhaerens]MCR6095772.1 sensor histidine kinase [Salipaludibacillus agaradhaerens]MCR6114668.1 sensor histidine kinase [Salipaludibacillus agaradhaerens]